MMNEIVMVDKASKGKKLTKSYNLTEVPTIPVIV
jgi:hypothetical protein